LNYLTLHTYIYIYFVNHGTEYPQFDELDPVLSCVLASK